jgi:hypothetical protein
VGDGHAPPVGADLGSDGGDILWVCVSGERDDVLGGRQEEESRAAGRGDGARTFGSARVEE